nr:immunoglobulin heavy chain junction region [Macaca mulatta]
CVRGCSRDACFADYW